MAEIKITGIDDFNKAIAELSKDLRKRVIRTALRAASKPLISAMQAGASVLKKPHPYRIAGLMRSRIVATNSRISSRRGEIGLFIKPRAMKGVAKGAKSPLDPFYYRFIAGGFHAVGRGGRVRGGRLTRKVNLAAQVKAGRIRFIKGTDFIGKAFRSAGSSALNIFQTKLKARIDAANRRK